MNNPLKVELFDRAFAALRALGIRVETLTDPAIGEIEGDRPIDIAFGNATTRYLAALRQQVTPATLGATVAALRDLRTRTGMPVLLVTGYVTPPVAQKLREQHQAFADAAGNVHIEAPNLLVYVVGNKPAERTTGRVHKAITPNGIKVLFLLLRGPDLAAAPHRTIAAKAGVALGAIPAIFADLERDGRLLATKKNRRFQATKRDLDAWAVAYAQVLRPRTMTAAYTTPDFATWKEWAFTADDACWGGEPAAQILVGHLEPEVLTLYARDLPRRFIVEHRLTTARPRQGGPHLELRKPFWPDAPAHDIPTALGAPTAPPVLVYADLLATGDARCIETAQLVYERYLAQHLPPA
jgi:hypothetical protein